MTNTEAVLRFNDRAGDYVRYRPGYPAEAIDWILESLGPAARLTAADVGAGTGISARLLGDRGVRVIAVEPGEVMRRSASAHPNVSWTAGRAEATGLAAQAVDLVLCAQAFHWFQPIAALQEFARILKPHGRVALMWNRRSKTDPLTAGYRDAIVEVAGEIEAERMPFEPDGFVRSGCFGEPERFAVPNLQRLDLDGLLGRARSASYVPKTGAPGQRLIDRLTGLHARHADADGIVALVYETEVFRSSRH